MTTPLPPDAPTPAEPPLASTFGPKPAPMPVATNERAFLPDFLRGFAIIGIAIINVQDFSGFEVWRMEGINRAVQVFSDTLFNGRSISLFALLFGWGAAGLLARHSLGLFVRRHLLLLGIGTAHFVLLWHGDIIMPYAAVAFALALLLRFVKSNWALLVWASALFLLFETSFILSAFTFSTEPRFSFSPEFYYRESYFSIFSGRLADLPEHLAGTFYLLPYILALFLIGAWLRATGLLSRPERRRRSLRWLAGVGLGLGLPLGLVLAYLNTLDTARAAMLGESVRMVGGLLTTLGYVGAAGLALPWLRTQAWARALAASGRMALTHYIAQSLIFTLMFYPYTFGLYGTVDAAVAVGAALVVALAQVAFAAWYLRRHPRGPLETALRWAVYGRARSARQGRGGNRP